MINFTTNQPEKNKKYTRRIGVYGILIKGGLLAVAKTNTGYFLPGGRVEDNESFEECLIRECVEEIGIKIKVLKKFACGNYYFYSTASNINLETVGHFYECEIVSTLGTGTEPDHKLVWLSPKEAIKLLYLENQKKAVEIFLKNILI